MNEWTNTKGEKKLSGSFSLQGYKTRAICFPPYVSYRQVDGFILQLMCPGDLLGSDDYHVPAMFWFEYAQGTLLCVTFPVSI